jgi:hypothetical protein
MSYSIAVLRQSPIVPVAAVQPGSFPTATAGSSEATTVVHSYQFPVPPLQEDQPPCFRLQPSEARQLTASSGNHGESSKGLTEGPNTTAWPRQLHLNGGNTHRRGNASGYFLPQQISYNYTV